MTPPEKLIRCFYSANSHRFRQDRTWPRTSILAFERQPSFTDHILYLRYPIFNNYPAFIVDFQVQERERIRQEELDFLRERAVAVESRKQIERLKQEEQAWARQQQLLLDAEKERQDGIRAEENRLEEKRRQLENIRRDQLVEEFRVYEQSRQHQTEKETRLRQAERTRLDDGTSGYYEQGEANFSEEGSLRAERSRAPPTDADSLSRIELLTSGFNDDKIRTRRRFEQQESEALRTMWQVREKLARGTPPRPV